MRTLKQIAQLIKDTPGGSATIDSKFDIRDIILYIRSAANQVLKAEYYPKWNQGDRSPLTLNIATYPGLVVTEDSTQRTLYVTLPEGYMALPHNKGVHAIHSEKFPADQIIKSSNKYVADKLPAGHMEGEASCWVEGLRVNFRSHPQIKVGDNMIAKLVIVAPDTIGEDDVLPLLPEQEAMIIDNVRQRLTDVVRVPQDALNDGNKDIGVTVNG